MQTEHKSTMQPKHARVRQPRPKTSTPANQGEKPPQVEDRAVSEAEHNVQDEPGAQQTG